MPFRTNDGIRFRHLKSRAEGSVDMGHGYAGEEGTDYEDQTPGNADVHILIWQGAHDFVLVAPHTQQDDDIKRGPKPPTHLSRGKYWRERFVHVSSTILIVFLWQSYIQFVLVCSSLIFVFFSHHLVVLKFGQCLHKGSN
jgi:hypothetical protein